LAGVVQFGMAVRIAGAVEKSVSVPALFWLFYRKGLQTVENRMRIKILCISQRLGQRAKARTLQGVDIRRLDSDKNEDKVGC
jgi:hypothetical protein